MPAPVKTYTPTSNTWGWDDYTTVEQSYIVRWLLVVVIIFFTLVTLFGMLNAWWRDVTGSEYQQPEVVGKF